MTLSIEGFRGFVSSTPASIATGWKDSYRVGLSPTEDRHISRRTFISLLGRSLEYSATSQLFLSFSDTPNEVDNASRDDR